MFTIKVADPKFLNNLVTIIAEFVTEATFVIEESGLKLVAIDPANVAMVTLNILPSAFAEYSIQENSEVTLNLENLKLALKRAKPGDMIELTTSSNKFNIRITGNSTKKFSIPLLEKSGADRGKQEFDFKSSINLNSHVLKELVEDVGIVSDAVTFEAETEKLTISAGDTGSKVNIELKPSDEFIMNYEIKDKSRSIYSVNYLKKIAKACAVADVAKVSFSTDYPLSIEFKALDKGILSFILAPRIENR